MHPVRLNCIDRDIMGLSDQDEAKSMRCIEGRRHLSEPPSKAHTLSGGAILIHQEVGVKTHTTM